ncbi:TlpA family protein disulfide reductase [Verrucomicrobiales bacterium]|nr:TlpA family protein disulfide reductase [Verrucomicrobiales bacterium]
MQRWKVAVLFFALLFPAGHSPASDTLPDHHISQWKLGENVNGEPITPALYSGKVVLLTYWGIRSEPSIEALATLAALDKKNRAEGLVTIAAEIQKAERGEVLAIIGREQVTYPVVLGSEGPEIGGAGLPKSLLFDITGKLVFSGHPKAPGLEAALKKSLLSRSRQQILGGGDPGASGAEREWSLADGSKITASLIKSSENSVKLRLPGGRVVTKKMAELSQKEQRRLAE